MAYTDHYTNKISMEHTWAHRTTLGHRGHKMGSKWLVNLLQRKNPRLQRSGFIPSNYSRKRGPDGKARLHLSGQKQMVKCPWQPPARQEGDSLPPSPMELPPRQVRLYPDFTFLPCSETCRQVRCHGTVMHVQHPTDKVPRWHGGRGLGLSKDKGFSEEWCILCIFSGFAEMFLSI